MVNIIKVIRNIVAEIAAAIPAPVKKRFQNLKNIAFYFYIGSWPVIVGIAFEISNRLKESIKLAWNIFSTEFFNYEYRIDIPVLAFMIVTIAWGILFFYSILIENKDAKEKFDKLQSAIIKAPDFNIYRDSRLHFNQSAELLSKLENDLSNIEQNGVRDGLSNDVINDKKRDAISVCIIAIQLLARNMASHFFHKSDVGGANVMIYYAKNSNQSYINVLKNSSENLYFRPEYERNLLGILHMIPELHNSDDIRDGSEIDSLILPVYEIEEKIYNNSKYVNQNVVIPGAILACHEETSMIGDTQDIDEYYYKLNDDTVKEVTSFFSQSGKHVRSFASFRIPNIEDTNECVGILNLDSKKPYSFGKDESFFPTFYSMIYPSLAIMSKYLIIYRELTVK